MDWILRKHQPLPPIDPAEYYAVLALVALLVIVGGIGAGLTIGLMSLDSTTLTILRRSGTPEQKNWAARIAPIRQNAHMLLVTLLLMNTIVNESLPVLLHIIRLDGYLAVLISTALIVIFGEIIPQAVCSRHGLAIGAFFAWPVRIIMFLMYPIVYPIAKLLDWVLGQDHGVVYRKAELKELVAIHGVAGKLVEDEVQIVKAVLDLREKTVGMIMTPLKYTVMLPIDAKLDHTTLDKLLHAGHSRVPVYKDSPQNIIGGIPPPPYHPPVVIVKQLVNTPRHTEVTDIPIRTIPRVTRDTPLFGILHLFQQGGSHMAIVVEEQAEADETPVGGAAAAAAEYVTDQPPREEPMGSEGAPTVLETKWMAKSPLVPFGTDDKALPYRVLGIVTMEDVIEEMIGSEILDETDVFVDVAARTRVSSAVMNLFLPASAADTESGAAEADETAPLLGNGRGEAARRKRKSEAKAGILAEAIKSQQFQSQS
ncbi:MAG: hypothetical protein SGCHY_005445, partial [Lobulomycetales sp.]